MEIRRLLPSVKARSHQARLAIETLLAPETARQLHIDALYDPQAVARRSWLPGQELAGLTHSAVTAPLAGLVEIEQADTLEQN